MTSPRALQRHHPVAVGGLGGSGTRLVARLLRELGYYMGSDVNDAGDNLWYSLLFQRHETLRISRDALAALLGIFINAMVEGRGLSQKERDTVVRLAAVPVAHGVMRDPGWLPRRADLLLEAAARPPSSSRAKWGWKEPNTHIIVDRLFELLPRMRYIHVARNGLDMAFSSNQNQLLFWGPEVLGLRRVRVDPFHSLKYWCQVHRRVLAAAARAHARFLLLNFDALCSDPVPNVELLCRFLEVQADQRLLRSLADLVEPPASIGRYRAHNLSAFDPDDVAYVGSLGFATRT